MTTEEVVETLEANHDLKFDKSDYTLKTYKSRHFRIIGNILHISDTDFDRWANSVESEIDFSRMKSKRF
jgi:hypothetical protein